MNGVWVGGCEGWMVWCVCCWVGVMVCMYAVPQVNQDDAEGYHRMIDLWFQFCMIWSLCASVDESGRRKMDTFVREMEAQFPPKVCP